MWLGVDDTDSPKGGCTTWVLSEVVRRLAEEEEGIDLVGAPRLVRLNPNVPFKTRGNAALGARFGRGCGRPFRVGGTARSSWSSYPRGTELTPRKTDRLWEVALEVVRGSSQWGQAGTDPAVVLSARALPSELYWHAVREPVPQGAVLDLLAERPGTRSAAFGSGEGIVGAAAALAWPARRRTWEAIAYRGRTRWGSPRTVDPESVRRMSSRYPETFLSYDERTRRTLVAPHTPCPILCGVRGTRPERLLRALAQIDTGETPERWLLFQTNQATGDHLVPRRACEAAPGTSGIYQGLTASAPRELKGGHVEFLLEDGTGAIPCVAFEPSKTLAPVARQLAVGDRLRVWGSTPWRTGETGPGAAGGGLRLEGILILSAPPLWEKSANPRCPNCEGRTVSWGKGKGFRCRVCRTLLPLESAPGRRRGRGGLRGSYLPTPSARRHLAPLRAPSSAPFSLNRRGS